MAAGAVLQKTGLDLNPAYTVRFSGRVWGALGNPVFLAGYLSLTVPVGFYFLSRAATMIFGDGSRAKGGRSFYPGLALAAVALIALILQVTALYWTRSRGPLLALAAGLFLLAILTLIGRGRPKTASVLILILLLIAGAAFSVPGLVGRLPANLVSAVRLEGAATSGTGLVRLHLWRGVMELIAANPARLPLGYGPETMAVTLPPHTPAELMYLENPQSVPDRAHNALLDRAASQGLVGVAAFIFFLGCAFRIGLKRMGLASDRRRAGLFWLLFLLGGAAGWLSVYPLSLDPALSAPLAGLGLVGGLFVFLLICGFRLSAPKAPDLSGDMVAANTLLSVLVIHWVEIQFGFSVDATGLFFLIAAALLDKDYSDRAGSTVSDDAPDFSLAAATAMIAAVIYYGYFWAARINVFFGWAVALGAILVIGFGLVRPWSQNVGATENREKTKVRLQAALAAGSFLFYLALDRALVWYSSVRDLPGGDIMGQARDKIIRQEALFIWTLTLVGIVVAVSARPGDREKRIRAAAWRACGFVAPVGLVLSLLIWPNLRFITADTFTKGAADLRNHRLWTEAAVCLERAVEAEPEWARRYQNQAQLLFDWSREKDGAEREELLGRALRMAQKASLLAPRDFRAQGHLAELTAAWARATPNREIGIERMAAADRSYQAALALAPRHVVLMVRHGFAVEALGDRERAIRIYERALELYPEDFQSHLRLAFLRRWSGDFDSSRRHAREALRLAPPGWKNRAVEQMAGIEAGGDNQ